jgi:catechol-2,3-dioxygenase
MRKPPAAQLTHLGIYVRDLDAAIRFYTEILGLVVTDSGGHPSGGRIAFLTRSSEEHHQVVLVSGLPAEERFSRINQISFRVATLEDLRQFHVLLVERNVPIQRTVTHGNAWSIYAADPDGNKVEIYTPSPWHVSQPFGVPVDYRDSVEKLVADTEAMIRDNASRESREAWSAAIRSRLE